MFSLQELDESWHDAALDDLFDRGVFLLREQLPEFSRSIQLARRVVGEDTLDHLLRQLMKEKKTKVSIQISPYGGHYREKGHIHEIRRHRQHHQDRTRHRNPHRQKGASSASLRYFPLAFAS